MGDAVTAELAIRRTLAAYCQSCDDGRFDDLGACFTTDARVVVLGREVTGREAITSWMAGAMPPEKRGRHLTVNSLITVDGERAGAVSDFAFLALTPDGPRISTAGRYYDELRLADGEWLIARREISLLPHTGGA